MTTSYDLRNLLVLPAAWAPPDDPPAGPDPSSDDNDPPAGDVAGEGDQEGAPSEEAAPENPELKKLHDEAARHRVRAKDAEAKALGLADTVRSLRLRIAFNALAGDANLTDTEAAWKLAADDLVAVQVDEDGTVDADRLGQIVDHVAERYPYLASAPVPATTTTPTDTFPPSGPSGRPTNSKRKETGGLDVGRLEAKFPALGRHRR